MKTYLVTWEIEIDADSPTDAAKLAREIQADYGTSALVFEVIDEDGNRVGVDLINDPPTVTERV